MGLFVFASWPFKKNSTFNLVLEINIKQKKSLKTFWLVLFCINLNEMKSISSSDFAKLIQPRYMVGIARLFE
jgi:hypothetical protein